MKNLLLSINHSLLFLCVSMYLGTGWSLILFSFPIAPQLTVDNYYLQFVPQVTAATEFFTWMTVVMMAAGLVMTVAEWCGKLRWVPIVVLLAVGASTLLTILVIIPLNNQMAAHITDPTQLKDVLSRWMMFNRIRVSLWTVQWAAMMFYFARKFLAAALIPPVSAPAITNG
jgi:hypothetical protein